MAKAIFVLSEDEVDGIRVVMEEIRAKDETFRFSIFRGYEGDWLLTVFAKDKDEAYRRAAWIWDKVFNKEKWYVVKE